MRVIAYDRFKPGVTMETIQPLLAEEVANCWRLWKAGVVRENYARADEPGVVIVFEVESVAAAKAYVADFPMTKAGGWSGPSSHSWRRLCWRVSSATWPSGGRRWLRTGHPKWAPDKSRKRRREVHATGIRARDSRDTGRGVCSRTHRPHCL